MHSLSCVLGSRAAPVPAFEVRYKCMGLHHCWFHALCGSGGLRELCVTNTKYREFYPVPPPIYTCHTLTTLDLCNWRLKVPPKIAGLRAVRSLRLRWVVASDADLRQTPFYYVVRSLANVSIPKRLNKKSLLHGLEALTVFLDHNNEVHATLVSCLLNSSPNLKDLRIREYRCYTYASLTPFAPEFWEKQINADCVLNHLSSFTFFIESPFEGHPCGGLCRFMVMNARVLKGMRIEYLRSDVKPEHAANLEAIRNELNLCPRASPDVLVELSPFAHYPSY